MQEKQEVLQAIQDALQATQYASQAIQYAAHNAQLAPSVITDAAIRAIPAAGQQTNC
jgi:hypothetical protein